MGKRKPHESRSTVPRTIRGPDVSARTPAQKEYLRAIAEHDIVFGIGPAGTGKTFLAAAAAMAGMTKGEFKRIVLVRPAVTTSGERIGFLPGTIDEKMDPFLRPVFDAFGTHWSAKTIADYRADGLIEIVPLAYVRGRTFSDTFVIADECQNATPDQMFALLTRLGENGKIVITGDPDQADSDHTVLERTVQRLESLDEVAVIRFTSSDVQRHPLVGKIVKVWSDR